MLKIMKNKIKLNNKTHKLATFAMLRSGERFGEYVGQIFRSCYMHKFTAVFKNVDTAHANKKFTTYMQNLR